MTDREQIAADWSARGFSCDLPLAIEAFEQADAVGFLINARSNQHALHLVVDNVKPLMSQGIYEPALVCAFTNCRMNWCNWDPNAITALFHMADPVKLRESGDPLPGDPPFKVYRGVAGPRRTRRVHGLAWTADVDTACWFAVRHDSLKDPAVYQATLRDDDLFCYTNERNEQEFIGRPRSYRRLPWSVSELTKRANRFSERNR